MSDSCSQWICDRLFDRRAAREFDLNEKQNQKASFNSEIQLKSQRASDSKHLASESKQTVHRHKYW